MNSGNHMAPFKYALETMFDTLTIDHFNTALPM